jgi:hypothetical protein
VINRAGTSIPDIVLAILGVSKARKKGARAGSSIGSFQKNSQNEAKLGWFLCDEFCGSSYISGEGR